MKTTIKKVQFMRLYTRQLGYAWKCVVYYTSGRVVEYKERVPASVACYMKIKAIRVTTSQNHGEEYHVAYISGARRRFSGWCPSTVRAFLNAYMTAADRRALYRYGEVLVNG